MKLSKQGAEFMCVRHLAEFFGTGEHVRALSGIQGEQMIAWKDLVSVLNTGHKPPFSLEDEKQLRRWCCAEFGVETMAVYHWIYSGRLPPHVRQQLVMLWPEVFHKIEYGEKGAKYEPQADNNQRQDI